MTRNEATPEAEVPLLVAFYWDCPLGQIYGSFTEGLHVLGLPIQQDGVDVPSSYGFADVGHDDAWKAALDPETHPEVRVARGILLLDEKGPERWWEGFALAGMDMDHTHNCLLARIYGDFFDGVEALGLGKPVYDPDFGHRWMGGDGYKNTRLHGFCLDEDRDIWVAEIRRRRGEATTSAPPKASLLVRLFRKIFGRNS